jgi:hypothetical protein
MSTAQLAWSRPSDWYDVWVSHTFQWCGTSSVVDLIFRLADMTVRSPPKTCDHHTYRQTHFTTSYCSIFRNFWNVINVWYTRNGTASLKVRKYLKYLKISSSLPNQIFWETDLSVITTYKQMESWRYTINSTYNPRWSQQDNCKWQADFVIMLAAVELVKKFQFLVTTFKMKIYYFVNF